MMAANTVIAQPSLNRHPAPPPLIQIEEEQVFPDSVRRIVIDPGHGGSNEGAMGSAVIAEKYLSLQVAMILADRLRMAMPDVEIILTRQNDREISLADRIRMANRLNADLFLSLHFNSSGNPEAIGFESFWAGDYWLRDLERDGIVPDEEMRSRRTRAAKLGERMAKAFNRCMRHQFDVLDRGVKQGDYTVLTKSEVPAVVLELAFVSHAQEGVAVTQAATRSKLVAALVEAVKRYASNEKL